MRMTDDYKQGPTMLKKVAIAVTFFYDEARLEYLQAVARHFSQLAEESAVFVITNTEDAHQHQKITSAIGRHDTNVVAPQLIGHPYLLTWTHRAIFANVFKEDQSFSHFLYLEDDIELTSKNIEYWIEGRERLRPYDLYPSFLRYEISRDGTIVSSDVTNRRPISIHALPHIELSDNYFFVNLRQPYQGMYLMDRDLFSEFVSSTAYSPDFGKWQIRERAAQGLTFFNTPEGFYSRNVLGYHLMKGIDHRALIHHLPNNYALDPKRRLGSIAVNRLLKPAPPLFPRSFRWRTAVLRSARQTIAKK